MRKLILTATILTFTFFAKAQKIGTDSKGKSIFSFYSLNDYRLEIATDEPLSIGSSFRRINTTFTVGGSKTVIKSSGMYLNLSLLNSTNIINFNTLGSINPGLGIKLGYQNSIKEFSDINITPKGTYAWGINGVFNYENIKLFNTIDSTIGKKYPLTYGLEANFTYFSKGKLRNMIAVNASLMRTWNDDDLLNYQDKKNVVIGSNVVALEDFEGRFGELRTDISKFRLSVSSPFYLGYLNPIPYVAIVSNTGGTTKYFLGSYFNILTSKLEPKGYTIPSSIGIGVDWTYSSDKKWSSANIFLRGAINFGKYQ